MSTRILEQLRSGSREALAATAQLLRLILHKVVVHRLRLRSDRQGALLGTRDSELPYFHRRANALPILKRAVFDYCLVSRDLERAALDARVVVLVCRVLRRVGVDFDQQHLKIRFRTADSDRARLENIGATDYDVNDQDPERERDLVREVGDTFRGFAELVKEAFNRRR